MRRAGALLAGALLAGLLLTASHGGEPRRLLAPAPALSAVQLPRAAAPSLPRPARPAPALASHGARDAVPETSARSPWTPWALLSALGGLGALGAGVQALALRRAGPERPRGQLEMASVAPAVLLVDPRSAAPRMEASEDAAGATADAADASADAADAGGAEAARRKQYDVSKLVSADPASVGRNSLDPFLSLSSFVSRRFGLVGGLAVVGILAATEGNEILKAFQDTGPVAGSGEVVTTSSGLRYVDVRIGTSGSSPVPGNVVGFKAKVSIGDQVLYDTANDKPVAFKLGSRPFQNIVCEGVEEGLRGMKVGGQRTLFVPKALAPPGLQLPDDVPLQYEIEVTEVLSGYF